MVLAAPMTASAKRAATARERSEIYYAVQRFADSFEVGGQRYRLTILDMRLWVSSVNSRWAGASVDFRIEGTRHIRQPALFYRVASRRWVVAKFSAYNDDCRFTLPRRIERELAISGPCT